MINTLSSKQVALAIRTPMYWCKVAQIFFGRTDGSLYVNFPYYKHSRGLISIATITGRTSLPTTVDLVPGGKVTSHLVKYSHHPDGRAHFSQDGKVRSIVRKQSNTLRETEGHIFTIQLQGLQGFMAVDIKKDFSTPVDKKAVVTFELLSSTINYEAKLGEKCLTIFADPYGFCLLLQITKHLMERKLLTKDELQTIVATCRLSQV